LAGSGARRLDRDQRLHLVRRIERALKPKLPPWLCTTMMHGQTFCHQRVIGLLRHAVVDRPARNALLRELVEGVDREFQAIERDALAADLVGGPSETAPRPPSWCEQRLALKISG